MADDPEYEKGLQKAYRLLAVRARSERELRTKLKEKKFDRPVIDRVVARLYELTYLDDEAFARQWARHLAVDKLSGNRRIEMSLQEKGVDRTTCERILAEIRQEAPEKEAIRQVVRKKLKGGKLQKQDGREKRRLVQHLLGRGFAPDLIFEVIREAEGGNRDDDGQSD
jgi:regulatory protein